MRSETAYIGGLGYTPPSPGLRTSIMLNIPSVAGALSAESSGIDLRQPISKERKQPREDPVEDPVVRAHPEAGQRWQFVKALLTTRGIAPIIARSEYLLTGKPSQINNPESRCGPRWSEGATAFRGDRSTQHRPASSYLPPSAP